MTGNALTEATPRSLMLADDELLPVLRSSLYPGAKDESIKLVLSYCRAAGLDPMQKPVHLVPMNVKKAGGGRDDYEWRDVVMPGIGLYRTQAARTGELAGIDEPQFGPMISAFGVEFPDWCKVTVYRMIGGQRVAFTACEFWTENYATARRDSDAPNAMWKRRPRGQLAKCAEAQALRKAFPELGAQPTADETIVETGDVFDAATGAPAAPAFNVQRKTKPAEAPKPADVTDATEVAAQRAADAVRDPFSPQPPLDSVAAPAQAEGGEAFVGLGEIAFLRNKAKAAGIDLQALLAEQGGLVLERLTKADFDKLKAELRRREG